jgi:hypothetical protein
MSEGTSAALGLHLSKSLSAQGLKYQVLSIELTKNDRLIEPQDIKNLELVIVDVGGMVQPEKLPILEACTHYLIISSKPEAVGAWHEFCHDRGNLMPVAVIHSSLAEIEEVHKQDLRNWHRRSRNFSTDVLNNDATSTGRSPINSTLVL